MLEPEGFKPVAMGNEFVQRRKFDYIAWIKETDGKVVGSEWFSSKNDDD